MSADSSQGFNFEQVLEAELDSLGELRNQSPATPEAFGGIDPKSPYARAHAADLTGLAFSGGGIRSATFNLGVIQAFARVRKEDKVRTGLLSRFDYLSTVSGGGYIGSWLSAWLHRDSQDSGRKADANFLNDIQPRITTRPCEFGPPENKDAGECETLSGFEGPVGTSGYPPLEHAAVRYLRRYSNYLVPRLGLSGDMLAVVSLFLRNFVLLQLALITMLATVLLVPYVIATLSDLIIESNATVPLIGWPVPNTVLAAGLIVLLAALLVCSAQLAGAPAAAKTAEDRIHSRRVKLRTRWINAFWVLLCAIASWAIIVSAIAISDVSHLKYYLGIGALTYAIAWALGYAIYKVRSRFGQREEVEGSAAYRFVASVVVTLIAGAVFGYMGYLCAHLLDKDWAVARGSTLAMITLGPPVLLVIISFIVTIHIGTARSLFSELHREWWARLGGFVLFAVIGWIVVCALAFYAPPIVHWLGKGGFAAVIAWAGASGAGAWIARNATLDRKKDGKKSIVKAALMRAAPWLFLAGLACLVSFGVNAIILAATEKSEYWREGLLLATALSKSTTEFQSLEIWQAALGLAISFTAFLIIVAGLDINIFSAHTMYRNRLVRAYLGASRKRKRQPHPFTGFDPYDEIPLEDLVDQRPIPILNTTINMTGGDDLAWQTRRAASFAFTPRFVGYETKSSKGIDLGGYRRTSDYAGGLGLGTVLAISGAAASPNMGYHTSPSIAALLTAFNLRLGFWAGNPAAKPEWRRRPWSAWKIKSPRFAARPILAELTGSATAESSWINLSDGGHFDNLGIYELVRRRCRLIVVTDAGCDPQHKFEDLANTIRKCWTDLGVHIFFADLERIALKDGARLAEAHGSLGLIEYPDRERDTRERYGLILYLKSSLTRGETDKYVDIRQYAAVHEDFPHQTTGDQFFDENQFEAYRHLGFCVAEHYRPAIEALFDDTTGRVDQRRVRAKAAEIDAQQRTGSTDGQSRFVSQQPGIRVSYVETLSFPT